MSYFIYHDVLQYNTIQYKTYNAPYVTKMFVIRGRGNVIRVLRVH